MFYLKKLFYKVNCLRNTRKLFFLVTVFMILLREIDHYGTNCVPDFLRWSNLFVQLSGWISHCQVSYNLKWSSFLVSFKSESSSVVCVHNSFPRRLSHFHLPAPLWLTHFWNVLNDCTSRFYISTLCSCRYFTIQEMILFLYVQRLYLRR